ncbi:MAG TPA: MobA/MobL family protein [Candidatus Saccharimonadia bacterium]|nr:MobA/MobL family protein [Candidatus Saccharimonadia bacterium]
MALFHVEADIISKGTARGGSQGFAAYIARNDISHEVREGPSAEDGNTTAHARYLVREGQAGDDLVATGSGGLPSWATDAAMFWQAADRYEKREDATVARTYHVTLPRELSPEARLELAHDITETFFAQYPHTWAVHCPTGSDGQEQPHVHVVLSERRDDGIARTPEVYFRRAATATQDPATHGVRKDRGFHGKARLRELRAGIATLTNAALEREGHAVAVSHESLEARGIMRPTLVYGGAKTQAAITQARQTARDERAAEENAVNLAGWQAHRATHKLTDLSREAMVEQVRDRFWLKDTSPAREQERQASVGRAIERAYGQTGRGRPLPREEGSDDRTRRWELPLIGNRKSRIYHTFQHKNYGEVHPKNQVHFWTEQDAIDAGYRRAANDHYGPGSGQPMSVEEARQRLLDLQGRYRQTPHPSLAEFRARRPRLRARGGDQLAPAGSALDVRLRDWEIEQSRERAQGQNHDTGYGW